MQALENYAQSLGVGDLYGEAAHEAFDEADPLKDLRKEYHFPQIGEDQSASQENPVAYMTGNSLGLQHIGVAGALQQEVEKWRTQAVEGHFLQPNPWFEIDEVLRADMASVVGADRDEVVLMNTLTANLHLLLAAFYRPSGSRVKVIVEANPFPSDMYAVRSHMTFRGVDPEAHMVFVDNLTTEGFLAALDQHGDSVALVLLGAVHFLTGTYFDCEKITAACRTQGVTVGLDCAHAVGNVELKLHDWGIDFACWCTYKYLNGGPGNIAGAFVHSQHTTGDATKDPQPLKGWWGHTRTSRFALKTGFDGSPGAAAFQLSNPCVMSLVSLAPSLQMFGRIGMRSLREKSLKLTAYLECLLRKHLSHAVVMLTPPEPERRGCQISIRVLAGKIRAEYKGQGDGQSYQCGNDLKNDADALQFLLKSKGVVCDNRPPDILRIAAVPMYNTFKDVARVVQGLRTFLVER